jgi:hypothetical protein
MKASGSSGMRNLPDWILMINAQTLAELNSSVFDPSARTLRTRADNRKLS